MSEHRAAPQHWAVSVYRNGENLVTIESNCLSGKPDFTDVEAECIRDAGRHLLSFIGEPAAPQEGETPGARPDCRCDCVNCVTANHRDCYYKPCCPLSGQPPAESGPPPEEEAAELILHWQGMEQTALQAPANVEFAELAHRTWVMLRALLDQVQTLREENTQLRYLDGRLNKAGREQFDRAERAEQSLREKDAEIERLTLALADAQERRADGERRSRCERSETRCAGNSGCEIAPTPSK